MKIHKEFCPITLASFGKWQSKQEAFCNYDYFTQAGGSSPSIQPAKKLFKIFRCKGCGTLITIPLEQGYENVVCISCDRVGSTGSIKEFLDIKSIYE